MGTIDTDQMDSISVLLGGVVNSFEKLEILVHLYRAGSGSCDTRSIGRKLQLSPEVTTSVLAELFDAGIVCVFDDDDVGWSFDPESRWSVAVEVLVDLYEIDRVELLRLMKRVALQQLHPSVRASLLAFNRIRAGRKPIAPS